MEADYCGSTLQKEVDQEIRYATGPRHWIGPNDESDELNEGLAAAEGAAAEMTHPYLRDLFETSAEMQRAERDRRDFAEESD